MPKLTVPQAAFLATVVNNPSMYDPSDDDDHSRILSRYRYVLLDGRDGLHHLRGGR